VGSNKRLGLLGSTGERGPESSEPLVAMGTGCGQPSHLTQSREEGRESGLPSLSQQPPLDPIRIPRKQKELAPYCLLVFQHSLLFPWKSWNEIWNII